MNSTAHDIAAIFIIMVCLAAIFGVIWVAPTYAFLKLWGLI